MKKIVFASLFVLLSACYCFSQEEFVMPQARFLSKFSFTQLTGGIIIIHGLLDNIPDTLNFILDTGSGGISLDSSTVEEFHIPHVKSDRTIKGIAGIKMVDFANGHSLRLPNLRVDSLNFQINDYMLLTSVYGVKIDGIIGFSFFRRFIVKVDYDEQQVEIFTPGTIKYPRGGLLLRPSFSTLPLPEAIVTDERSVSDQFIFDTGAGLCALFSQDFVDDSNFISKKRKRYPTQAEGLGGKKIMSTTIIRSITVGPYKFRNVPVYLFNDEFNVTTYPKQGGLIGNDIFRRFNIILNYPDQCIYLHPNEHFDDKFDYAYTGLGIYLVNGDITVVDIMDGSPGAKAGFEPGDVIIAIDKVIVKNIQILKTALQNPGSRVKVLISRNKELFTLRLDIHNMRK